ncbi:hypothetical protein [Sphingobium yanoikuyae]|uniref:hypothetical protein n=1 Tax=Sphingobium yanoikuyae TaxID=13690 RepID=UPI003F080DFA
MFPDVADAVFRAVEERRDQIVAAADAGKPPVAMLIPDLDDLISEGFYWRRAEAAILELLRPNFEIAGKKPVNLTGLPRGRCYRRSTSPAS